MLPCSLHGISSQRMKDHVDTESTDQKGEQLPEALRGDSLEQSDTPDRSGETPDEGNNDLSLERKKRLGLCNEIDGHSGDVYDYTRCRCGSD
jgi:hypothetical protein